MAVACALAVGSSAVPAFGSRRPSDVVAGRTLAESPALEAAAPDMSAAAGILTTADGRVLWSRNAHERRAMASTTKIMTAIVVLEHAKLTDTVVVSKRAAAVPESGVGLVAGERLTVRELLEALLVKSANDAAWALAEHVGGSVPGFAQLMNAKAAELGCRDTHFVNPHGLDVPGHYTSAADLATMARAAMRLPDFRRTIMMRRVVISAPRGQKRVLTSTDNLIGRYDGLEGVKTGFTNKAGYCFVSAAKRGSIEVFGVVMGTPTITARFRQTTRLLDWAFAHLHVRPVSTGGLAVGTVPVNDYLDRDVAVKVGSTESTVVLDLDGPVSRRYELSRSVNAPVEVGTRLGTLTVAQPGRVLATVPIVASAAVAAPGFWERTGIWFTRSWRSLFGPKEVRAAKVTVAG